MRKLLLTLGCGFALLWTATVADAKIFVKITDGTVAGTVDGLVTPTKGVGLKLAQDSLAPTGTTDVTATLNVLSCATRPCTVFFPSGAATVQTGDTFKIQDVSSTSLARVEKFDSGASADRVSLKGVKITSLTAGKILTFTYGTQAGDLRSLSSTSTSYTGTVALTGTFKTSSGLRATACNAGLTATDVGDSCVKLSLAINGTTVNGAGGTAVATVSVPCNNSTTGSPSPASVNPCGVNGIYTSSLGSFTGVNDSKSISCPNTCSPTQVGTLVAEFNGTGEVLQLTASANGGMSNVSEEAGGLEEIYLTLADELGTNRWVAYTAAGERCRAVPKAPTTNDTRNITNNSTLPISFEFWCGFLAALQSGAGVDLVSIVDPAEGDLAGSAATRNDASRVGFVPGQGQLQLKNITVLSLSYDVVVGSSPSGNNTLGDLTFDDCTAGSFRVELELLDNKGVPMGTAKVYLGSNPADQFKSLCNTFETIGTDLVNNPDARVDVSGLAGNLASPSPITFQKLKSGSTGGLRVRKMSVIVDHGDVPLTTAANHKVVFFDGNVNGFTARDSLQVVTGVTRTFDLTTNGVSIVIKKLTGQNTGVVKVIRSANIEISGGKFVASVNVNEIQAESGAEYTISLCPNGAEQTNLPVNDTTTPVGICIPDQAYMTLQ